MEYKPIHRVLTTVRWPNRSLGSEDVPTDSLRMRIMILFLSFGGSTGDGVGG